ncbi:hypothetical protein BJI49_11645 [Acetobacter pasteurianus]|uniref:hypothetical protein n=1 Tax=Acetobacter pasteurianus TaxID=438 RepID=UPI00054FE63C|nr:hypothetical protein [Acetobacter pasteurianus]RCL05038.1 hypothetical protein BJI49_11645 [Acetobacter pasteurianus]GCD50946.1 hypothetical protein NBRC106471_2502 [Acetobacter pasteurianus subsp. pasteurianus LMG 1262 = NBRC 106471]
MFHTRFSLIAAATVLISTGTAFAQMPPSVRGTVISVDGDEAAVRTPLGHMTVHLAPDTHFAGVKKASLDDIRSDSYIGTAAVPATDGTLRALEVTIFPDALRGMGEGNYPWDLGKSGSMTNGAVSSVSNGALAPSSAASSMTNGMVRAVNDDHGRTIQVSYKGGMQKVALPGNIPVVSLEPADRSLLKKSSRVAVFGPVTGTTVEAKQIIIGEDGIKPPM